MNFLVDAQLPQSLAIYLRSVGHDAIHTLDLPDANASKDQIVTQVAVAESRVVVTKDGDFVDSFYLHGEPGKLLHVTTGNISNQLLLEIISKNLPLITQIFEHHLYIELSRDLVIVHV